MKRDVVKELSPLINLSSLSIEGIDTKRESKRGSPLSYRTLSPFPLIRERRKQGIGYIIIIK